MKTIAVSLFIACLVYCLQAQESIEIKDTTLKYIYWEIYSEDHAVEPYLTDYFQELEKQGLTSLSTGPLFAIYYDSEVLSEPDTVWRMAIGISHDTIVSFPFRKDVYAYGTVASMIFTAPYDAIDLAYNILIPNIEEIGMEPAGPPIHAWLDNPEEVPPLDLRTELMLPVCKKR